MYSLGADMGRPKKETDISAETKIVAAFWNLMETIDYSKITIQKLAEPPVDTIFIKCVQKLQICAGSNSTYIIQMLKKEIKTIWFRIAGIDENKLGTVDKLSIDFALSGIIAILGNEAVRKNGFLLLEFSKTDIGLATLSTMIRLAKDNITG